MKRPGSRQPLRIVSLLPAATEIVAALGAVDELVGVTHECDEPAEIAARTKSGGLARLTRPGARVVGSPSAVLAIARSTALPSTVERSWSVVIAPSSSRMLVSMQVAMCSDTSSGSGTPRMPALFFTMATRVSNPGGSICATMPCLNSSGKEASEASSSPSARSPFQVKAAVTQRLSLSTPARIDAAE